MKTNEGTSGKLTRCSEAERDMVCCFGSGEHAIGSAAAVASNLVPASIEAALTCSVLDMKRRRFGEAGSLVIAILSSSCFGVSIEDRDTKLGADHVV